MTEAERKLLLHLAEGFRWFKLTTDVAAIPEWHGEDMVPLIEQIRHEAAIEKESGE